MGVPMLTTVLKRIASCTWTRLAGGFHHRSAQQYEIVSARGIMGRDFTRLYAAWEDERAAGELWQSPDDQWETGGCG